MSELYPLNRLEKAYSRVRDALSDDIDDQFASRFELEVWFAIGYPLHGQLRMVVRTAVLDMLVLESVE